VEYLPPGQLAYAGIDWGGWNSESRSGSYNCIGIGIVEKGEEEVNRIRLVYAEVLQDPDIMKNVARILDLLVSFNVRLTVADKGWGKMQIFEMRKHIGNRLVACQYADSVSNWYTFKAGPHNDDPTIVVDRSTALEETYFFLQNKRLVVPYNDQTAWIRDHCLGHRIIEEKLAGRTRRKFEKISGRLTDGSHMLNYLKLACGFENRQVLGTYLSKPNRSMAKPMLMGGGASASRREPGKPVPHRPVRRVVPLGTGWRNAERHRRKG